MIHLPESVEVCRMQYTLSGLPGMTSSKWLTQDTKNEGNACRLCFFRYVQII